MNALREECQQLRDELIALRREFHRDPELGLHEYHTAARIERELDRCASRTSASARPPLSAI